MPASHAVANVLAEDLDGILDRTRHLWEDLRGERLFVTGGTGFIGSWLLESFVWANRRLALGASAGVLTRDPAAFGRKAPHLAEDPSLGFLRGDVQGFEAPDGKFRFVIHAAANASVALNRAEPLRTLDTIVSGTRRVLDTALSVGAVRFLLTSSGAIYGKQPGTLSHIPEEYVGAPDPTDPLSAYGEGKRIAELTSLLYATDGGLEVSIARCFAFVGPYLPLEAHFAAGNFIGDRLRGNPISVNGDGTPRRSYLYAADLAAWLWTLLFRGPSGRPYNVGSEDDVSIRELAEEVAGSGQQEKSEVHVAASPRPGLAAQRYVPSTRRIAAELGLEPTVDLREAIARTLRWNAERRP